jgi:small subunit ribosomal protein S16
MLVIRLQRTGLTNEPTYRIVIAEKSSPVKGKCLEIVGFYLPSRDPPVFEHKPERITHWISHGAAPSDTVARLLHHAGMKGVEKFVVRYTHQKPKQERTQAKESKTTAGGTAEGAVPETTAAPAVEP